MLERLRQPLLQPRLSEGLLDHLHLLAKVRAFPERRSSARKAAQDGQLAAVDR